MAEFFLPQSSQSVSLISARTVMRLLRLACLALAVHSSRALRLVPTEGRRAALGRGVAAAAASAAAASAAATAALRPTAAMASTAAELTGVQAGFDEAAEKRARYQAMQKDYKKAWRKAAESAPRPFSEPSRRLSIGVAQAAVEPRVFRLGRRGARGDQGDHQAHP